MGDRRHYAVIDQYNRKLTLKHNDEIIAVSSDALLLKEVGKSVYDPVFYLPKNDVIKDLKAETDRKSFCPIKGDASYWNVADDFTDNYFAWSYEDALLPTKKIKGYMAFNPEYITFISEPI